MTKMSFKEAAQEILNQAERPLTASEIVDIAIEKNLIETEGKTPAASMAAQLYIDIRDNKKSPFVKVGRGLFSLKTKKSSAISPLILLEQQNNNVKNALKEKLHEMDPIHFEVLIADLLQKIGYEDVKVTKRSGDKGIDVEANLTVGGITNVKTVIQAKRHQNNIQGGVIAQLRGSAEVDQRGLVVTTADFSKGARSEAIAPNKMPVALINGEKLIELLFKYDVGVKKEEKVIYSLDLEYFENIDTSQVGSSEKGKNRAMWPLPGGTDKYIETLNEFLKAIESGINTKNKLIKWFITNYDNVESEKTSQGYINVPKNMGLIDFQDGKYFLTEAGKKYLEYKDLKYLYEVISENVMAFDDIYEFLKTSNQPKSEQEIFDYLKDNFDIDWTTFAQVTFRLLWLLNLGKIEKTEFGYKAIE